MMCLLVQPGTLAAQSDPTDLARIAADRLDAAQASLAAADGARDRVDALSRTIRAYEDGLNALREGLRRSALREAAIVAEFEATSSEVSRLLGVMMSIGDTQGPLALIHPAGPLGGVRSGIILGDVTPAIQARAQDLEDRLNQLAVARGLQEGAAALLAGGLAGAQKARTELSKAIAERRGLPERHAEDSEAMTTLRDSAETLQDFASGLIELHLTPATDQASPAFETAKGALSLPVRGQVLRRFNEEDAAGIRRPGLIIAARPLALVTTPWPATMRYAGPLLDYGQVAILEPQAGIMLVLAGMGTVYDRTGEVLPSGAPVGLMGGATPEPNTFLLNSANRAGSAQTETLYIELRQGTEPVDPATWFAETKDLTR